MGTNQKKMTMEKNVLWVEGIGFELRFFFFLLLRKAKGTHKSIKLQN